MSQGAYYRPQLYEQPGQADRLPSAIFFEREEIEDDAYYFPPEQGLATFERHTDTSRRYGCLPILSVSMTVDVHSAVSRSLLKQSFHNGSSKCISEATYAFPLYDGSTVIDFTCEIGDERLLQGEVHPKNEAQKIFQKEIAEQRTAALLEEHTPEVFEVRIGNIPPQTTVKAEIVYLTELKADISGRGLMLTIPTSIAPRYGASPRTYQSSSLQNEHHGLEITVDICCPVRIQRVESVTHPISVETDIGESTNVVQSFADLKSDHKAVNSAMSHARAKLADRNATLSLDFVLLIFAANDNLLRSQAVLEPARNPNDEAALMVTLNPQELLSQPSAEDIFDGEIIFLADRSGSMRSKMPILCKSMKLFLKSLPYSCHFNIASFGSRASKMWPLSKPWSEENIKHALGHIESDFAADMGGTEILSALKFLFEQSHPENITSTQIVVLTDGETWDIDGVRSYIADQRSQLRDRVRFFALGLGDRVSHGLVRTIGDAGCGFSRVVTISGQSPLNQTVIKMLEGALMPASWNCELILDGFGEHDADARKDAWPHSSMVMQAPSHNICLHPFTRRSVFMLINPEFKQDLASVIIKAKHPSGQIITRRLDVSRSFNSLSMIHELTVKAILLELENTTSEASEVPKTAQSLGTKYRIIGKWTSFVAVDRNASQTFDARVYKAKHAQMKMQMQPTSILGPYSAAGRSTSPLSVGYDHISLSPNALPSTDWVSRPLRRSSTRTWCSTTAGDSGFPGSARSTTFGADSQRRNSRQSSDPACLDNTNLAAARRTRQRSEERDPRTEEQAYRTYPTEQYEMLSYQPSVTITEDDYEETPMSLSRPLERERNPFVAQPGSGKSHDVASGDEKDLKATSSHRYAIMSRARQMSNTHRTYDLNTTRFLGRAEDTNKASYRNPVGGQATFLSGTSSTISIRQYVESLDDLVDLQEPSGCFGLGDDALRDDIFKRSRSINRDQLTKLCAEIAKEHDTPQPLTLLDTMITILYMMIERAHQEDEWKFIVRNGLKWLANHGVDEKRFKEITQSILAQSSATLQAEG